MSISITDTYIHIYNRVLLKNLTATVFFRDAIQFNEKILITILIFSH